MIDDKLSWWQKFFGTKGRSLEEEFDAAKTPKQEPEPAPEPQEAVERHEPIPDQYPAPGGDWQTSRNDVLRSSHNQAHSRLVEQTKKQLRQEERDAADSNTQQQSPREELSPAERLAANLDQRPEELERDASAEAARALWQEATPESEAEQIRHPERNPIDLSKNNERER